MLDRLITETLPLMTFTSVTHVLVRFIYDLTPEELSINSYMYSYMTVNSHDPFWYPYRLNKFYIEEILNSWLTDFS